VLFVLFLTRDSSVGLVVPNTPLSRKDHNSYGFSLDKGYANFYPTTPVHKKRAVMKGV
jgi:hypothetical protein